MIDERIPDEATQKEWERMNTPQFSIIGVAASLAVAMPLLAVGAAFAVRIFCYIAGGCG